MHIPHFHACELNLLWCCIDARNVEEESKSEEDEEEAYDEAKVQPIMGGFTFQGSFTVFIRKSSM